ncbi:MAG: isovaleryl-CoA dehydrogenase [Candidatus Binatia bacterium]
MSNRIDGRASATHEVLNQPPPLTDYNLYDTDTPLVEALRRADGSPDEAEVRAFGQLLGRTDTIDLGFQANTYTPELRTHDRFGHRIDEVEYHPAWHALMRLAMENGLHNLPWKAPGSGAHSARSARHYMLSQIEAGVCCPLTMTFASLPALRHQEDVCAEWEPHLLETEYDPRLVPASQKRAVLIGMAMTEKQGGSDVRANTTRAREIRSHGPAATHELTGHKWFCSAPMSDAFLTLAHTDKGLSCFLVPRVLPDGTRNPFRIQQLKNKLGNRSNASSEIEYDHTLARRVGEDGRGIRTIIEMVHHTRLDCVSGSAGLMRQALAQAAHHSAHREAFGRRLVDQPLMYNVLADLALELEGTVALMARLAQAYDRSPEDENERAFARIATAVGKYWVCKRAPHAIYEAMECLGGNGYVEDAVLARLYREAPVNSIWEGSSNVMCLDVLRALAREPGALPSLLGELDAAAGGNDHFDHALARLRAELADLDAVEVRGRRIVELMAVTLQASLLVRHAPAAVADAFCTSRLDGAAGGKGLAFGTLPPDTAFAEIIGRAMPESPAGRGISR